MSERRPSKSEINRAGRHLAARLQAVRAGSRHLLVDLEDETDLRARELVEWWRDEHLAPMDETRRIVATLVEQLNEELAVHRVRDWARQPRASGYRAVHLHVRQAERMIEVQVRTVGQDARANLVEDESLHT